MRLSIQVKLKAKAKTALSAVEAIQKYLAKILSDVTLRVRGTTVRRNVRIKDSRSIKDGTPKLGGFRALHVNGNEKFDKKSRR